jgi:hypothetical protein
MKKTIILIVSLICIVFLNHTNEVSLKVSNNSCGTCESCIKNKALIDYILNNIPEKPVNSRFTPIIIHRYDGKDYKMVGSGSIFNNHQRNTLIVTAEHVLSSKEQNSFYTYQTITKDSDEKYYAVESFEYDGYQITGEPADVALLKPGQLEKVENIIDGRYDKGNSGISHCTPEYKEGMGNLISLASGRSVKILGTALNLDEGKKDVMYLIVDYDSIKGESGSGFVDQNDNIYILKGSTYRFKTPSGEKDVTMVYGPLNL